MTQVQFKAVLVDRRPGHLKTDAETTLSDERRCTRLSIPNRTLKYR